jgi:hypothetical protein
MKEDRPKSRSRVETKWKSHIFEGPLEGVPERLRKTKIKQPDSGTEGLFGVHGPDFQKKNQVLVGGLSKPANKKWTPILKEKTAD